MCDTNESCHVAHALTCVPHMCPSSLTWDTCEGPMWGHVQHDMTHVGVQHDLTHVGHMWGTHVQHDMTHVGHMWGTHVQHDMTHVRHMWGTHVQRDRTRGTHVQHDMAHSHERHDSAPCYVVHVVHECAMSCCTWVPQGITSHRNECHIWMSHNITHMSDTTPLCYGVATIVSLKSSRRTCVPLWCYDLRDTCTTFNMISCWIVHVSLYNMTWRIQHDITFNMISCWVVHVSLIVATPYHKGVVSLMCVTLWLIHMWHSFLWDVMPWGTHVQRDIKLKAPCHVVHVSPESSSHQVITSHTWVITSQTWATRLLYVMVWLRVVGSLKL